MQDAAFGLYLTGTLVYTSVRICMIEIYGLTHTLRTFPSRAAHGRERNRLRYGTPLVTKIQDSRRHVQNAQCHVQNTRHHVQNKKKSENTGL